MTKPPEIKKEIAIGAAIAGGGTALISHDLLLGAIFGAGAALSMSAAYDAAVDEFAKMYEEEARHVRTVAVSGS